MENNKKTIIYEEQIYGQTIKSIGYDVHSYMRKNNEIYTRISNNNKITTEIVANPPKDSEVKSGNFKFISEHIDQINDYITILGAEEEVDLVQFLSTSIYQIMQAYASI